MFVQKSYCLVTAFSKSCKLYLYTTQIQIHAAHFVLDSSQIRGLGQSYFLPTADHSSEILSEWGTEGLAVR